MKRIGSIILSSMLILFTGCMKTQEAVVEEGINIDSSSHSITLSLDGKVEIFWVTDNQSNRTIEGQVSADGKNIRCKGPWFSAELSKESPRDIILTVDKNESGKDRQLTISAYSMGKRGSTDITQKAD